MTRTVTRIGPLDHGRHMSLKEFDPAEGQPGYLYELSRGVVTVMDVPNRPHVDQVDTLRQQLEVYRATHSHQIYRLLSSGECKILIPTLESERHPDLSIYKRPPAQEEDLWSTWIPEIVIEVVSPGSEHRDYVDKPEEYLLFGIREYWIVDAAKQEVLVLRRSLEGWKERTIRPPKKYRTRLLPGFEFDCGKVFQAAQGSGA
jgi:Uma2 family endonuclease